VFSTLWVYSFSAAVRVSCFEQTVDGSCDTALVTV